MSIAKIHGFTAWVNLRLVLEQEKRLNNILVDLFQDTHWQKLIESITGAPFEKIGSFTGLTQIQKTQRIEWIIKELKSWKVFEDDVDIDPKLVAVRNSEEMFSFLLKLISHDGIFLWRRMEYFQQDDAKRLSQYELKITPNRPATAKPRKFKVKKDLLAGFGAAAEKYEEIIDENDKGLEKVIVFPFETEMMEYKRHTTANSSTGGPKVLNCILSIINNHLKMSKAGKNIKINKLTDICDIRVLCGIFNVLFPHSFSTEIIPNDRFSINLILKTLEKIVRIDTDFDAADLNSRDTNALIAYFIQLFLAIFKFRQIMKVLEYKTDLEHKIRFHTFHSELFSNEGDNLSKTAINNKKQLMEALTELDELKERFDIGFCESWHIHKTTVLKQMFENLRKSIDRKFEIVTIPRIIIIGDMINRYVINTKLMKSCGYYQMKSRELITDDRDVILRNIQTDKFITNSIKNSKSKVRSILKVQQSGPFELDPTTISKYEIFVDTLSKNKSLLTNDKYLYKLFPGSEHHWKNMLITASTNNDIGTIEILFHLFSDDRNFVNWQEPDSSNSALHLAAFHGHFDACLCLLENGADVNLRNRFKLTPLFNASEEDHENICGLLLEWGADILLPNVRNLTVTQSCKSNQLKQYIEDKSQFYLESQQKITDGDEKLLQTLIHDHRIKPDGVFISLRSRCIHGSTLLHTASHFSNTVAVKELLMLRVDVNVRDYKGASALHRATDLEIIDLLIESGADVNLCDYDGNLPLHAACYGVEGQESQVNKIKILINQKSDIVARNKQLLMPIHCAAMQGHSDVIGLLLDCDSTNSIRDRLFKEGDSEIPPSIVYLALFNGYVQCALWTLDHGFTFKDNEANELLRQLITGNISIRGNSLQDMIDLLIHKGNADINRRFPPTSQTTLHLAAGLYDSSEMLDILLRAGADIDATDTDHCTPLFVACKSNNTQSAKILIENGANINVKNNNGQTPFDYIPDYYEWINCGIFNGDTIARLKAYNLKQARNTIRSIDKKMNFGLEKDNSFQLRQLESRLDQSLIDDLVERSKSQLLLRPRSLPI